MSLTTTTTVYDVLAANDSKKNKTPVRSPLARAARAHEAVSGGQNSS